MNSWLLFWLIFMQNGVEKNKKAILVKKTTLLLLSVLHYTLCLHSICYFNKTNNISSFYIINISISIRVRLSTDAAKTSFVFACYFPENTAFLFSKNAVVPSLKSWVPKLAPKFLISTSKPFTPSV
jgi:hypothetical protein